MHVKIYGKWSVRIAEDLPSLQRKLGLNEPVVLADGEVLNYDDKIWVYDLYDIYTLELRYGGAEEGNGYSLLVGFDKPYRLSYFFDGEMYHTVVVKGYGKYEGGEEYAHAEGEFVDYCLEQDGIRTEVYTPVGKFGSWSEWLWVRSKLMNDCVIDERAYTHQQFVDMLAYYIKDVRQALKDISEFDQNYVNLVVYKINQLWNEYTTVIDGVRTVDFPSFGEEQAFIARVGMEYADTISFAEALTTGNDKYVRAYLKYLESNNN